MILSKPSLHPFDWLEKNDGEQFLAGKFELSFRIYDPGSNTKCRVMVNVNRDHLLQFVKKTCQKLHYFPMFLPHLLSQKKQTDQSWAFWGLQGQKDDFGLIRY